MNYPNIQIPDSGGEYRDKLSELAEKIKAMNPTGVHPSRLPKMTRAKLLRFLVDNSDRLLEKGGEGLDFSAL